MSDKIKIAVKNLYKIFGDNPQSVLEKVKAGMHKQELLEQHEHVIGLNNINVNIGDGKITVIMGLSGSGKSTLIRHFNRLIEPTAGEILIDGTNALTLSQEALRELRQKRMSMVFQKFALFPHQTVIENAGLAYRISGKSEEESDQEAQKWLNRVGLTGFEQHHPHQLSGGMQQRVGLARALTSNSEVMLMDEAFSALDPLIRTNMQNLLLELQNDLHKTIIFITHDLDEALKLADHLVILKDGYIVQQGDPQYILLNPNDPYIEDFVSDINRTRVLRVRSVMTPVKDTSQIPQKSSEVNEEDTLESLIAHSEGEMENSYVVMQRGKPVGLLNMNDIMKALVPRVQNTDDTTL